MKTATKTAQRDTYEWLMERNRHGVRRIEKLGWKHLAKIYDAAQPGSFARVAIQKEARRCGYLPDMILGLNR